MKKGYNPWERWSVSKLNLLQKCPKSFEFEYVLGMKDRVKQGIPKIFGSSIHYMFDKFFALRYGYKSLEKFIKTWIYYWLEYIPIKKYPNRLRIENPEDMQKYLAIGINILKKFYYENLPYRTGELPKPQVEETFNLRFKGHRVTGKIDRIQPVENNEVEIWDYKTGYKKPTEQELIRDIQFTLYNLAWFKKTGKNPIKMRLIHLFSGEQIDVPLRTESDYIQLGCWLDEARIYVRNILEPWHKEWKDIVFRWFNPEDIERGYFPKRPSYFCAFCDYEELCRESHPKDKLKERWVKQDLAKTGPYPEHIQLELLFPKAKRQRKKSPA